MVISEAKNVVDILEKTGLSQATIAGLVIALFAIVVCALAMIKMCNAIIKMYKLMMIWDKNQEVDRVTYRAEFLSINKSTDCLTIKVDDHEHRLNVLEK